MIEPQPNAAPLVRCDAPECPAVGQTEVGAMRNDEPTVGHLPDGWRAHFILREERHFCPTHAERWL